MELRNPDVYSAEFIPKDSVHILVVLKGVREVVRVIKPWGLLDGRGYWLGRWCGFGDGVVDLILDKGIIYIISEGYI